MMVFSSELDVEQIYPTLSGNPESKQAAMSVAEKHFSKGRIEGGQFGISKGEQIGRIRVTEELLRTSNFLNCSPGQFNHCGA